MQVFFKKIMICLIICLGAGQYHGLFFRELMAFVEGEGADGSGAGEGL